MECDWRDDNLSDDGTLRHGFKQVLGVSGRALTMLYKASMSTTRLFNNPVRSTCACCRRLDRIVMLAWCVSACAESIRLEKHQFHPTVAVSIRIVTCSTSVARHVRSELSCLPHHVVQLTSRPPPEMKWTLLHPQ